jgi:hypothetical protein
MKTKSFLFLCLIISIATTRTFAQLGGLERLHTFSEWGIEHSWFNVECNGVPVETFTGDTEIHYVRHFEDGIYVYYIAQLKGEFTSESGEVFKISEVDNWTRSNQVLTFHGNLVGNRGTHYILSGTMYFLPKPATWTIDKAVCLENDNR